MEKFDPENSGSIIDELFKDILENVWFSLQLPVDDAKYIQFRVVKKGTDVTKQLNDQDQELYFYTPGQKMCIRDRTYCTRLCKRNVPSKSNQIQCKRARGS